MIVNFHITKQSFYDMLHSKGVALPPPAATVFFSTPNSHVYRLCWYSPAKEHCSCMLRCEPSSATLTLRRERDAVMLGVSTIRMTPTDLCSYHLATPVSSLPPYLPYRQNLSPDLQFYYVLPSYAEYLRSAEMAVHGVSHIPYILYEHRFTKFLCGPVRHVPNSSCCYYAPVSSKYADGLGDHPVFHHTGRHNRLGTLRLKYMFPAPPEVLAQVDIAHTTPGHYRHLLQKQLATLQRDEPLISVQAAELYRQFCMQPHGTVALSGCCDFPLLEHTCRNYCAQNGLSHRLQPAAQYSVLAP